MSVRDDILNQKAQKGTKAWSEEHDTQNNYTQKAQKGTLQYVDSTAASNPAKEETVEATSKPTDTADNKKTLSFKDLYEILTPKPDPEQLKKDAKRARTRNIIAALGDGISAIANLHYTTKGAPNMYDGKSTLTAKSQARYDKLMQDYKDNLDKYKQGQLKAEELDREWNHMTEREKVADEQWNKSHQLGLDKFEYQKGRDKVGDEQWNKTHEFRQKQSQQTQDNWQKTFDEGVRRFNESAELKKLIAELNAKNKNSKTNSSKKDKDVEYVAFTSKDKGSYKIDKDTWDDISEQLYRYFVDDKVNDGEIGVGFGALLRGKNKEEIKDFLQNHWHESASVTELIKNLSEQSASDDYDDKEDLTFEFNNNDNQDLDW